MFELASEQWHHGCITYTISNMIVFVNDYAISFIKLNTLTFMRVHKQKRHEIILNVIFKLHVALLTKTHIRIHTSTQHNIVDYAITVWRNILHTLHTTKCNKKKRFWYACLLV